MAMHGVGAVVGERSSSGTRDLSVYGKVSFQIFDFDPGSCSSIVLSSNPNQPILQDSCGLMKTLVSSR